MISIVDDDESVRAGLKTLLRSAGYEVQTFASAGDFLQAVSELAASKCLILDVRMPGIDGMELQGVLQARGSQLPIIFITAHDDEQLRQRVMDAGAVGVLHKPFEATALLAMVKYALAPRSLAGNGAV